MPDKAIVDAAYRLFGIGPVTDANRVPIAEAVAVVRHLDATGHGELARQIERVVLGFPVPKGGKPKAWSEELSFRAFRDVALTLKRHPKLSVERACEKVAATDFWSSARLAGGRKVTANALRSRFNADAERFRPHGFDLKTMKRG